MTTKNNVLYFEGAGGEFYEDSRIGFSDVGNYRIRTAFKNNDGIPYYLELGNGIRYGNNGKSKKLVKVNEFALYMMFCHEITGGGNDSNENSFPYDYKEINKLDYTKETITNWVNENLNCSFDTIEVLGFLSGYNVHADNRGYNLMDDFKVDHELTKKRIEAYNKIDQEYRKALNEKYSVISVLDVDEKTITIRCHASDTKMSKTDLERVVTIEV